MRLHAFFLAHLLIGPAVAQGRNGLPPRNPPQRGITKTKDFTWIDPYTSTRIKKFTPSCTAEKTFSADEFLLHDLFEQEPTGLWPYGDALKKVFSGRAYPGSWGGMDPHMYDRPLMRMNYAALPLKVREWIEDQERSDGKGKGLYAVYERAIDNVKAAATVVPPSPEKVTMFRPLDEKKIVIFAPGALYEILPLWVAEGSECQGNLLSTVICLDLEVDLFTDSLSDLARYSAKPKEGAVVAVGETRSQFP